MYLFIGLGVALTVAGYGARRFGEVADPKVVWLMFYFEPNVMKHGMRPEIFIGPGYIAVFSLPICLLWSDRTPLSR